MPGVELSDQTEAVAGIGKRRPPPGRGTQLVVPKVMTVRDLMQADVVTLDVKDHLDVAEKLMHVGHLRHIPVLQDGQLVGVVSQRDLFQAAISTSLDLGSRAQQEWLATISLRDVMSKTLLTVAPQASLAEAVKVMLDNRIGCLPVVDGGRLVGMLSETDCLRHLGQLLAGAAPKSR